jgi:hypothetical protein
MIQNPRNMLIYSFRFQHENVCRISLILLNTDSRFDYMVRKSISGDTGEECLEGIIQTVKDLIAQVDIKIRDTSEKGA